MLPKETEIEYELDELGRLEDIRLWYMLHRFMKDWPVTATWEYFMLFLIDSYNMANKHPLESKVIEDMFNRIRRPKNEPTTEELVHFTTKLRLTKGKIRRVLETSNYKIDKSLENLEPFLYKIDLHPDMTKFNDFLMNGFRETYFGMSNPKGWNSDYIRVWEQLDDGRYKFVKWEKDNRSKKRDKKVD